MPKNESDKWFKLASEVQQFFNLNYQRSKKPFWIHIWYEKWQKTEFTNCCTFEQCNRRIIHEKPRTSVKKPRRTFLKFNMNNESNIIYYVKIPETTFFVTIPSLREFNKAQEKSWNPNSWALIKWLKSNSPKLVMLRKLHWQKIRWTLPLVLTIWSLDLMNINFVIYWTDLYLIIFIVSYLFFRFHCDSFWCQWFRQTIPIKLRCNDYDDGSVWWSDLLKTVAVFVFSFQIADFLFWWHVAEPWHVFMPWRQCVGRERCT